MFLTRGIIPYEDTWRQFLDAVPERVPGASGGPAGARCSRCTCTCRPTWPTPRAACLPGTRSRTRITVEWGQWSVVRPVPTACQMAWRTVHSELHMLLAGLTRQKPVAASDCLLAQPLATPNPNVPPTMGAAACQAEAERLLLAAALADAGNQRFVLVSETCIPLYPAPVVWAQLLGEPLSRMHACRNDSDSGDAGRRRPSGAPGRSCASCCRPLQTPSWLFPGLVGSRMVCQGLICNDPCLIRAQTHHGL